MASSQIQIGSEAFEDRIISPLFEQYQYPHQNPEPFVVEVRLEGNSLAQPPSTITVLDFPGEVIEADRHEQPWEQQQNEDTIRQQYNELNITENVIRNQALRPEDWNTILTHEYFQSDNLIFLLNLYKFLMNDQPESSYDADDLRKVAKEKDVAVVATGTDILNHRPDEDIGSVRILDYIWKSRSPVDSELLDTINDATTRSQVTNILNTVKIQDDISFFGVAVPSREPGVDDRPIATEGGDIETWGFGNIVEWLDQ